MGGMKRCRTPEHHSCGVGREKNLRPGRERRTKAIGKTMFDTVHWTWVRKKDGREAGHHRGLSGREGQALASWEEFVLCLVLPPRVLRSGRYALSTKGLSRLRGWRSPLACPRKVRRGGLERGGLRNFLSAE